MELTPDFLRPTRDAVEFRIGKLQKKFQRLDIDEYDISVDPYEQISVAPDLITEWSRRPLPNHHDVMTLCGSVQSGDWDVRDSFSTREGYEREYYLDIVYDDVEIEETTFYKSMIQRFENDVPWTDTGYVQSLFDVLERQGSVVWGGERSTKNEILQRCDEIDSLYASMVENGYLSQRQLGNGRKAQLENEILVDIARDGSYLLVDGKHRLAIARILDLPSVQATVLVRHKQWVDR